MKSFLHYWIVFVSLRLKKMFVRVESSMRLIDISHVTETGAIVWTGRRITIVIGIRVFVRVEWIFLFIIIIVTISCTIVGIIWSVCCLIWYCCRSFIAGFFLIATWTYYNLKQKKTSWMPCFEHKSMQINLHLCENCWKCNGLRR